MGQYAILLLLAGCGTTTGALHAPCPTVRVSEVMTANDTYEPVNGDWFQMENYGTAEVDLSGFLLRRRRTADYRVPDGVALAAGAFQLFLAETYTTAEDWQPGDPLTTGFDFNGDSESLELKAPDADGNALCEEVRIPHSHPDFSWQRDPDADSSDTGAAAEWCFASEPTPFGSNAACLCAVRDEC